MKRFTIFLMTAVMVLSLAACGTGSADSGTASNNEKGVEAVTGPIYTVDVKELALDIYPDDYPLIASDAFETAFGNLKEANSKAELDDYQDVIDIFGVDGAYYENCDMEYGDELYRYYGWYADNGVSILITFKADGDHLEYYAWSGNGIS